MTPVSTRRRVAALVALASALVLAAAVVVILLRNGTSLAIGLVGLCLAVAGGWWLITEPMPRRAIGIVGVVAGLAAMVFALAHALNGADRVDCAHGVGGRASRDHAGIGARRDAPRCSPARHPGARERGAPATGPAVQPVVGRRKGRTVRPGPARRRARRGDGAARPRTRSGAARA